MISSYQELRLLLNFVSCVVSERVWFPYMAAVLYRLGLVMSPLFISTYQYLDLFE